MVEKAKETLYVAIDPGETTGLATYSEPKGWHRLQMGPQLHHLALLDWLRAEKPDVIICEQFFFQRRREKVILTSKEYIGVVQLYWQMRARAAIRSNPDADAVRTVKLVMQSPSDMLFWDDKRLQTLSLYIPGKVHANDATRHMLYYFTKNKDHRWVQALKEPETL